MPGKTDKGGGKELRGAPRRVIFRDLQHVYPVVLDNRERAAERINQNPFAKILDIHKEPDYVPRKISQLIDHKLGIYVIKQLVDEVCANFGYRPEDIIIQVRSQFREILAELHAVLPKGRWYQRSEGMKYDTLERIRLVQGEGAPLLRE